MVGLVENTLSTRFTFVKRDMNSYARKIARHVIPGLTIKPDIEVILVKQ